MDYELGSRNESSPMTLSSSRNRSILVIGQLLYADVQCIEWGSTEPNVADYDIVIMDLTTTQKIQLPPLGAYSKQPRFQVDTSKYLPWLHIRRSFEKLLLSGGRVFLIGKPEIVVHPDCSSRLLSEAQSTGLLPFVFFGEQISGQSIAWVDPQFDFYFRELGNWKFVLTGKVVEDFGEQVTCQVRPLAKNRANEILALSVSVWGARSKIPGVVYLLPPPTKITSSGAIKLLLAHLDDLEEVKAEIRDAPKLETVCR